jgi:prolyl-tRNA synthetase
MRRDKLRDGDKIKSHLADRAAFVGEAAKLLVEIQASLLAEARARQDGAMQDGVRTFDELAAYFGADESDEFKGWARVSWSRPTGAALAAVGERLKALKLTIRNAPMAQPGAHQPCLFTGAPGVEQIIIARSY